MTNFNKVAISHNCILDSFCNSIYLFIFLYVLIPEGDIRRVPGNHVLGVRRLFLIVIVQC